MRTPAFPTEVPVTGTPMPARARQEFNKWYAWQRDLNQAEVDAGFIRPLPKFDLKQRFDVV